MAYYDALIAKWQTLPIGSVAEKTAAINALTVPGPNVDVAIPDAVGILALAGVYQQLVDYSASESGSDASKVLAAFLTAPNAPPLQFSIPDIAASLSEVFAGLVTDAANTGITQEVADSILALSKTTILWWKSAGYTSPIGSGDLDAAGITQ